jgi:TonB family protein
MVSEQAFKKALLFALLVHLFVLLAIPTYAVRVSLRPSPIITVWPDHDLIDYPLPEKTPLSRPSIPVEADDEAGIPEDRTIAATVLERSTPPPVDPPPVLVANPAKFVYVFHEDEPELYRHARPVYPEIMRTAGLQDTVVVLLFVDAGGTVTDHEFTRGEEQFRHAVRAIIPTMRFHPATANGRKVGVWISQSFTFRLKDR